MKKKLNAYRCRRQWLKKMLRVMKIGFFLLVLSLTTVHATTFSQQKVSLDVKNETLLRVLDLLQEQSDYTFLFSSEDVQNIPHLSVKAENENMFDVLKRCLQGTDLSFEVSGQLVILKIQAKVTEPDKKSVRVKGFVYDTKKEPMPGVTVKIVGLPLGTATNDKGWFALDLPLLKGSLEFSFVGYKKKQVGFTEKTDTLRIVLEEDMSDIDEVVVRAYGTQKKREVVSAISTVTAEEMKELPAASITSMLQGRLAGVNVIMQSGAPGSAPVVAVRGFNSLLVNGASDGQPLWVVDGVPIHSFVSPVTGTNTLADLDPSMIESVQVLKDAAAASIYGSRAGNGVILITTKKGRDGAAKFSANASYSIAQIVEWPLQTGGRMERWLDVSRMREQRATIYSNGMYTYPTSYEQVFNKNGKYDFFWGNGSNSAFGVNYALQDSLDPYYNNVQNWWKYVLGTGEVVNANIQASGGTDRFQYMVGAGYYDEKGIMINSAYSRVNLRTNLSAKLTEKLHMDTRIYLSYMDKTMNRSKNSSSRYEGLEVKPDKQPTYISGSDELQEEWLKKIRQTKDRTDDYRAMASMFLEYDVLKGLSFSASGNIDYSQSNMNKFTPSTWDATYNENTSSGAISRVLTISTEELLRYQKSFKEKHNLDLLFGVNAYKEQNFYIGGYGKGGSSDDVYYYDPGKNPPTRKHGSTVVSMTTYQSDFSEKVMVSYFTRLGYNYKQRYLMELTFRRDGSSTFGEGNRWANFPSVALGWTFSEEPFVKRFTGKWLNWGKIRGSYGTSGQIFSDAYLAYGLIKLGSAVFQGNPVTGSERPISPDLTWEKTEQYDLGLDLDMFDYRVNLKLDYYYKYTSSLIYKVPLPASIYPFSDRTENAMAISNEGIEMELMVDILRESPLSWRTKLNLSKNWNRFEKSYSGKDIANMIIGRSLNGMFLYEDNGYYESENEIPRFYTPDGYETFLGKRTVDSGVSGYVGTLNILDKNGDGSVNVSDTYVADSPIPKVHGGWVNELRWRNFDLNMLMNFSFGRKMVNRRNISLNNTGPKFVDYRDLKFWTEPGCDANLPMLGTKVETDLISRVENVHSMSLKQLTIGYNLPDKIAGKAGFSGVRFFATGENLFYWCNYSGANPEVVDVYYGLDNGNAYPLPRKWTLGLTLNF